MFFVTQCLLNFGNVFSALAVTYKLSGNPAGQAPPNNQTITALNSETKVPFQATGEENSNTVTFTNEFCQGDQFELTFQVNPVSCGGQWYV